MRLIRFTPRFWFALTLLVLVLLLAFVGPLIHTVDPNVQVGGLYDPPSVGEPLGTDNVGHDVLSQLMHGMQASLAIGLMAGVIATVLGVVIGVVAGFVGGSTEEGLMGVTNVALAIPSIVVLILISIALNSRSLLTMAFVIGITSWPWTARAVRAQASSVSTREHIDVARLSGAKTTSLVLFDVLPYILSYIAMAFVLQVAGAILAEAGLSILGLGPSDAVSLGTVLHYALVWESVRTGAWWAFIPPTIILTVIAFSLLLLQSSLDEVFNPRLRGGRASKTPRAGMLALEEVAVRDVDPNTAESEREMV
jgi:peptide/nickel transport system permease protein